MSSINNISWQVIRDKKTFLIREVSEILNTPEEGYVVLKNNFSSINYRDLLAVKGNFAVARRFPYCPGVDASGTIIFSNSTEFKCNDDVAFWSAPSHLLYPGGWSKYVIVHESLLFKIPHGWDFQTIASIGTAGFAAALGIASIMINLGEELAFNKKLLVTGASGGVGSIACILGMSMGFQITAQTRSENKQEFFDHLNIFDLEVIDNLDLGNKHNLLKPEFDCLFDTVGGEVLVNGLKRLNTCGAAVSAGLVLNQNMPDLTVLPFIMRGISLSGTGSEVSKNWKKKLAMDLIFKHINLDKLELITKIKHMKDICNEIKDFNQNKRCGRIILRIN